MIMEILTPEEFAERMKIGRSTVFDWKSKGILKSGKHFIQQGRKLLFVWSDDTIISLLESSVQPDVANAARPVATKKPRRTQSSKTPINWDC